MEMIKILYSFKDVKSVLEIGKGPGIFSDIVTKIDIDIKTLDIDSNTNPDFIGSVLDLPFEDNSYDIGYACQVLEHIPFEDFEKAISEISRVSKVGSIISLPDNRISAIFSDAFPSP